MSQGIKLARESNVYCTLSEDIRMLSGYNGDFPPFQLVYLGRREKNTDLQLYRCSPHSWMFVLIRGKAIHYLYAWHKYGAASW